MFMSMGLRSSVFAVVIAALLAALTSAQQPRQAPSAVQTTPGAMGVEEATMIAQGWALLAQGLSADAGVRAAKVLAAYPRSVAALSLAVEVAIARGGSQAGLAQYERWLGQRTVEEPALLRRIAHALLREAAAESRNSPARLEALRALAADGDVEAIATLSKAADEGGIAEQRALASMGNAKAVATLIANLNNGTGNAMTIMEALAESGSKAAIAPLTAGLKHSQPEIRGAAVEALGKLGSRYDLIATIKPMLADQASYVRLKAAGALYGLNDMSGLQILQDLAQADVALSRLMAAQAMASRPDGLWLDQVRRLTAASEPEVRVNAARLLAPHDPEAARKVLEGAMSDGNPAIREMATGAFGEVLTSDFPTLRHQMKSSDRLTGVKSAARVLVLANR